MNIVITDETERAAEAIGNDNIDMVILKVDQSSKMMSGRQGFKLLKNKKYNAPLELMPEMLGYWILAVMIANRAEQLTQTTTEQQNANGTSTPRSDPPYR